MLEYCSTAINKFVFSELCEWKRLIDCDKLGRARVLRPKLEKRSKEFGHVLPRLCYEMYAARFYRVTNDIEAFDKTMAYLETVESEIEVWGMLQYLYLRLKGMRALSKRQFKESLDMLLEAEKMIGVEENVDGDAALYYAIGYCLTDLHNPNMAIEYLKKAQWHAFQKGHQKYDIDIQCFLAQNYSKIGEHDEAFNILNECLANKKGIKNSKASYSPLGNIHLSYGIICCRAEKYHDALVHFETAIENTEEGTDLYLNSLYYKTLALIDSGNPDMALPDLEKGESLSVAGTSWEALFSALKHSLMLTNPESLDCLINSLIPKLQEYGDIEEVMRHYRTLSDHYKKCEEYEKALKYSNLALETMETMIKKREKGL